MDGSIHRYLNLAIVVRTEYDPDRMSTQDEAVKSARAPGVPQSPDSWLAGELGRTDPGSEAWSLMHWLMVTNKQRIFAMAQEFDLAPQQMFALRMLGTGPRKMSELAQSMFCDN